MVSLASSTSSRPSSSSTSSSSSSSSSSTESSSSSSAFSSVSQSSELYNNINKVNMNDSNNNNDIASVNINNNVSSNNNELDHNINIDIDNNGNEIRSQLETIGNNNESDKDDAELLENESDAESIDSITSEQKKEIENQLVVKVQKKLKKLEKRIKVNDKGFVPLLFDDIKRLWPVNSLLSREEGWSYVIDMFSSYIDKTFIRNFDGNSYSFYDMKQLNEHPVQKKLNDLLFDNDTGLLHTLFYEEYLKGNVVITQISFDLNPVDVVEDKQEEEIKEIGVTIDKKKRGRPKKDSNDSPVKKKKPSVPAKKKNHKLTLLMLTKDYKLHSRVVRNCINKFMNYFSIVILLINQKKK